MAGVVTVIRTAAAGQRPGMREDISGVSRD